MRHLLIFISVAFLAIFISSQRAYGYEVNSTLPMSCNDGGGGTTVRQDSRHIAGQAWKWSSSHTTNDDPPPRVDVWLSRSSAILGDSAYWPVQGFAVGGSGGDIGGDGTPYEYMIVKVECDGTLLNNNDFAGDFTVYGRIVEHTGMSVSPATIDQNGSSNISWSGTHAFGSWVNISDGAQSAQKSANPNGAFSSSHTYTNGGYVGTVTAETCVWGYDWGNNQVNICQSRDITVNELVPPVVDIKCDGGNGPCSINTGESVNITWWASDGNCWTTGGDPESPGWARDPVGYRNPGGDLRGPLTGQSTYTYSFTCENAGGRTSDSVTVFVSAAAVPVVDLRCSDINGPCVVLSGSNVTLSWTTSNMTSCTASGGTFVGGKLTSSAGESHGPITVPISYTLACTGPLGPASDTVIVSPGAATTVDLKCSNSTGGPYMDGPCSVPTGGNFDLQWTSANADSCTASRVPAGGVWTGPRSVMGTESLIGPSAQRVYALTCTGASTAVDYVTVNVQGPRDAVCAGSTIPATMLPGETRAVSMTFFNSGTMPWTDPDFDVSQWPWPPSNPSMVPQQFSSLPAGTVNTGGTATYNFNLTAPVTPGVYSGAYRMLEQNVEWFGQTCGQSVTVGSAPVVSDVTASIRDYCAYGPGADISWAYSGSTPQSAYRIQIDDDPTFASPNYAMGKVMSSNNSIYATGTGAAGWGPAITWGNTYYARIRVYDGGDVASPWTNQTICIGAGCNGGASWTTPSGPYPVVAFTNVPVKPVAGQPTQFTDGSVCLGGGCQAWAWNFGDGGTDTVQNPVYTYALQGAYTVKLDVTDANSNMCSLTKALNANKAIPFWKEVLPW